MSGRGRPRSSTKVGKGTSQMRAKCAVCTTVLRNDKNREYQISSVLFGDEGNPADKNHPQYISLSESVKLDTDIFRQNGFNRFTFPANKLVHKEHGGEISKYFAKKPRFENNLTLEAHHNASDVN